MFKTNEFSNMKHILKIVWINILILNAGIYVYPTAQIPDLLIVEGDTIGIFTNPLEYYYNEENKRPQGFGFGGCSSTACWRGYQAIWEIKNNQLYLNAIQECCSFYDYQITEQVFKELENLLPPKILSKIRNLKNKKFGEYDFRKKLKKLLKKKELEAYKNSILFYSTIPKRQSDLSKLFGEHCKNGEVLAFWFTGNLVAPKGKLLHYVHMGYGSIYEIDRVFEINKGKHISTNDYSNKEFFQSYYHDLPDSLRNVVYRNIDWKALNITEKESYSMYAILFINSVGKIDSVRIRGDDILKPQVEKLIFKVGYFKTYKHSKVYQRPKTISFNFDKENRKKYLLNK